jgi:hypothetical protein
LGEREERGSKEMRKKKKCWHPRTPPSLTPRGTTILVRI